MESVKQMLEKVHSVLLVDWPSRDIPLTLIQSGFTVFSYSPGGYNQALIESNLSSNPGGFAQPVFRPLNTPPVAVDLVMIYRPPEEHASIILNQALPLDAKIIWLQPPVESMETKMMAIEQGLTFVQGRDILEISR